MITSIPELQEQYQENASVAIALRRGLRKLNPKESAEIALLFKTANADVLKHKLGELCPELPNYKIELLGGSNNTNWLFTDESTQEIFCIRVEWPSNQAIVKELRQTPLSRFLSKDYEDFVSSGDSTFVTVVTPYAAQGNLRSFRENNNGFFDERGLIRQAVAHIGQILDFCQVCNEFNIVDFDIKLSNFLLDAQGRVFIADHKGLWKTNREGKISKSLIITTPTYKPPEHSNRKLNDLDGEKIMTYQLGLALYEYLVVPEHPENIAQSWNLNLDFDKPIFNTPEGLLAKEFIERATASDPATRIGLQEAMELFQKISAQVNDGNEAAVAAVIEKNPVRTDSSLKQSLHYSHAVLSGNRAHKSRYKARAVQTMKAEYQALEGDALKTGILSNFKQAISSIKDRQELESEIENFQNTPEYTVLAQGQGKTTRFFNLKTSSITAFEAICQEARESIRQIPCNI